MKYKHIQAAHEARMWISMLITGACAASAISTAHPEIKEKLARKVEGVKTKICKIFKKEETPTTVTFVVVDTEKES